MMGTKMVRRMMGFGGAALACLALGTPKAWCAEREGTPDRPISNPVYTDVAMPKNEVNLIYLYHTLPSKVETTAGLVPLDGHAQAVAVQLEIALSECVSLVANKSGYVWLRPGDTLDDQDGFGDLSAGLKWLVHSGDELSLAVRGTVELPSGTSEVFQGNGRGNISPAVIGTWSSGMWVANGVAGLIVPIDRGEESIESYISVGGTANVTDVVSLQAEINWFRVLSDGNGSADFGNGQLNNVVPTIAEFEGGDYFNLGSAEADAHRNIVTGAIGARVRATDWCSVGVGYEYPLTPDETSFMDDRVYVNLQLRF